MCLLLRIGGLKVNWTVCVPSKYLIFMPDIQELKFSQFTVQMLTPPPPLKAPGGVGQKANFAQLKK